MSDAASISSLAEARNPWPCERCGSPVRVVARAARVPFAALILVAAAGALAVLAVRHGASGALGRAVLAMLALLLTARLGFVWRARRAWSCPSCGLRMPPRLAPAGPLQPVVVVPTYNNAATIEEVVRRVRAAAPDLPLLVVDDGSTDGSGERARAALAAGGQGELLVHAGNRGKGAAVLTGLAAAIERGYSHAITIDADGQHLPEDLPLVCAALESHPTALIVGARDLSQDNVQPISRFGRRFSNFWQVVQTGHRVADSQCGLRVYPTAPTLSLATRARAYDFEVEVLILAARAGMPLVSLSVHVYYPPAQVRVSHFDKLWDNVRIAWVNTRLLAGVLLWPLGWPARFAVVLPPSNVVRAWSGRSRGGALGHLIFFFVLRLVGRRPAYLLLYPVAFYFMLSARVAVRASSQFLAAAVGPLESRWRRFWRSYSHVLSFAQCILDRAAAQVGRTRAFTWASEGHEHLAASHGAILLSAHLGNYEIGGALLQEQGVPLNVVMLDGEAAAIKAVHARFGATRPLPKVIAINRSEFPVLAVLRALRAGELVALHGDRLVDEHWALCSFFGRPAAFPTGAFLMAAAARVPIILTLGLKEGPSSYRFIAEPPRMVELGREHRTEELRAHAQWYAGRIEAYARAYPRQWFNFYDFWAAPRV
jgi:predicted LPLAT superfamily acyltransferase